MTPSYNANISLDKDYWHSRCYSVAHPEVISFFFFFFCMGCCQVFSLIVVIMSSCLQAAAFGSQDGLLTLDRLKSSVRDAVRQHGQKMVWETGTQR